MPARRNARAPWPRIAAGLICLCGAVPWVEADSSSQTIGVQIIVPERPSLPTDASSDAGRADDLPAPPDGASTERTATLIRDGNAVTILYTTAPSL